jgi:hypothetical protein
VLVLVLVLASWRGVGLPGLGPVVASHGPWLVALAYAPPVRLAAFCNLLRAARAASEVFIFIGRFCGSLVWPNPPLDRTKGSRASSHMRLRFNIQPGRCSG